ncbi:DUF674 family protein [Quillaja saponaria]|uniref:DUF674 family protein n=1 Tax=Quillaja saponaria TaxID=32244 RepID=A0AAD7L3H5_QUISA|nr:DUF674 family protein [Quillaja saponaria]
MAAKAREAEFTLRILVDKEKNRVVFAEAGKDFVDVLLSFLTFPLGTIVRLVSKDSNIQPVKVGSSNSLYKSVMNIDKEHFWTEICREMLLLPRSSMEAYCRSLKLIIDDMGWTNYFICENWECSRQPSGGLLSFYEDARRHCGKLMNKEVKLVDSNVTEHVNDGYVHGMFIILDDLTIMPNIMVKILELLDNLGIKDMHHELEERTVIVSKKESCTGKTSNIRGFTKGSLMYMVTNDLVVTPMPSDSVVNFLNKTGVPLSDLEERFVSIGMKEALSILKASLMSSSALTCGLKHITGGKVKVKN